MTELHNYLRTFGIEIRQENNRRGTENRCCLLVGPLTGVLMSHVDFLKCTCRLSLLLKIRIVPCQI